MRFLFVGRQDVFTKGLDLLLEAFALAHHQSGGRDLTLTMAGADWNGGTAWLRLRATELGVGHAVSFAGPMSGRDIAALLERADIYVQVSRHDGLPLSISEALLAGKPVILSDAVGTASHPEIASLPHVRIVSLTVCEIAGAMIGFVRSLGRLRMIAARHRTQIGHFFSWERIAAAQLAAYRDQRSARSPSAPSARALSAISNRARERRWTW